MRSGTTIGFDLDMTLIDPRAGMAALLDALGTEYGLPFDGAHFAANLGPPLDAVLREQGAPETLIPELIARFRARYPALVVPRTLALPGAAEALAAVHACGRETLVVTGKYRANAVLHTAALGLKVDHLVGELWAAGKAQALLEYRACAYVGDHRGDMRGARAAGVPAIGVASGPCDRRELLDAGAEVVLSTLHELPAWLGANATRLASASAGG